MPLDDPVKISRLTLENRSGRAAAALGHRLRRVGARRVARRVGAVRRHRDRRRDAARCSRATRGTREFGSRVAFADLGGRQTAWTGDRTRVPRPQRHARPPGGARARPRAVRHASAPGSTRAARCRRRSSSRPARRAEVVFLLGEAATRDEARALDRALPRRRPRRGARARSTTHWDDIARRACRCRRPIASLDLLLNRWLLYQTLACRVWARAAFYQAERRVRLPRPAAGRDGARRRAPRAARASICCARPARQFVEGDVQHWWHPPSGRGVRTRISDDLLWLPYVVAPLRRGDGRRRRPRRGGAVPRGRRRSPPEQDDAYFEPARVGAARRRSSSTARARSIASLAVGAHGLPLMGTGDWNDGMNRVGARGQGRERLARLVPARDARGVRAARRARAARRERAARWRAAREPRCRRRSSATAGTATGTGAPTSTTARRSARPRTTSAGSTRSRSRGR